MCGIAGIVDFSGRTSPAELRRIAVAMAESLSHRGPDAAGVWVAPDGICALSHRRLSVIDLSEDGQQPMVAPGGRQAISFNGEIYNYRELKAALEADGSQFRSRSDTEVLLAGLLREGTGFLPSTDAMFALALYDADSRTLLLARDAFGEKPLYYWRRGSLFAFASELQALTLVSGFNPIIERAAILDYLQFQYVPAPHTIYRDCRKLEPGAWLRVVADVPAEPVRWFSFRTSAAAEDRRPLEDLADEAEDILLRGLRRRLISDVPLGAFLSGGIDSSTVAALVVRRLGLPLRTFSIGFADTSDSEHNEAAEIARYLGTEHNERVLEADQTHLVELLGRRLDEPNADSSCLPTWLLSGFAREQVTVALSGDGGDEMFGGYNRYFDCAEAVAANRERIKAGTWHAGRDYYSSRLLIFDDRDLRLLAGADPDPVSPTALYLRKAIDQDPRPLANVLRELDAAHYMPGAVLAKVDRMSMQHALEVRTPFLSLELARFAGGLGADRIAQGRTGKLVLRTLAGRHLPADWLIRPKKGFGMPVSGWGEAAMRPVVSRLLGAPDCRLADWIGGDQLRRWWAEQGALHASFYQLWALALLETWLRTHPAVPAELLNREVDHAAA